MENIERVKLQFRAVGGLPLPSSIFEIDETPKTRDERLSGRAVSSLMKLGEFGGVCPDGLHELLAAEKFVLTAARLENRLSAEFVTSGTAGGAFEILVRPGQRSRRNLGPGRKQRHHDEGQDLERFAHGFYG